MNTQRENHPPNARPDPDRAVDTIIRGEDVLEEARQVSQKISERVSRAITERRTPDREQADRQ